MTATRRLDSAVDLRVLPSLIEANRDDGHPIVLEVERPLPEHAARLMDALGVEVEELAPPVRQVVRRVLLEESVAVRQQKRCARA